MFLAITFGLYNFPSIQIQLFVLSLNFYIIYLNWYRIHHERFSLWFENMNESTFLLVCYHLILFTNIIEDPETLTNVGKSMIISVLIILASSTLVLLFINLKGVGRIVKLRILEYKMQRKIKKLIKKSFA